MPECTWPIHCADVLDTATQTLLGKLAERFLSLAPILLELCRCAIKLAFLYQLMNLEKAFALLIIRRSAVLSSRSRSTT